MYNYKQWIRAAALGLLLSCGTGAIFGCSSGIPLVSEVKETEGYTDPQTMLIVATERNRYRKIYTDQIWQVQVRDDGTTFQTYLAEEIQNFLRELKTTNLLADEQNLTLTAQEKEQLHQLAATFYQSLTEGDLQNIGASEDDVYTMYEAYHRANRLVDELTKDVNLEISDSEARVIVVQEIRVSDAARAQEAYQQVTAEGADFAAIARAVSEDSTIEKSVGRSERPKTYEEPVFALAIGEISPVVEENGTWYIVKCINDYDEEATLERKQKLALQRKNQAFRQIYNEFAAEHPVKIRGSIWDDLSFSDGAESTTTDFFELYQEAMNS
ncbi:MAG: peptidylprolyl isomerase [Lachnospiraceae bacterium]|nr:peptidylprolyl isomerase [Lachnospiraceae bacterium]